MGRDKIDRTTSRNLEKNSSRAEKGPSKHSSKSKSSRMDQVRKSTAKKLSRNLR